MDTQTIEELQAEESMFVQTAQGIVSQAGTLTLTDVTPSTLYFSDRPQRVVGHMTTEDFVDLWGVGDNSFESDPPNAVLAFLPPGTKCHRTRSSSSRGPSFRTVNSPTRSTCSRAPCRRSPDPSPCSLIPSADRFHRSRCVECGGESVAATGEASDRQYACSHGSEILRTHDTDVRGPCDGGRAPGMTKDPCWAHR